MMYKHKKRMTAIIAAFVMTVSVLPCYAVEGAAEEILISNADQLIALAYSKDVRQMSGSYRMVNDIDMRQAEDRRPMKAIGTYSNGSEDIAFGGIFDGGGYRILNLSTTAEALFGYVGESGMVKNLTLENASIHYSQNDSSKYPAALASLNKGKIQGCMTVNTTVVSDYCSPAGGLVGTNFGIILQSGVSGGSVSFAVSKTGTSHGGFVGNQRGGTIEECFSTAVVEGQKWAGGFAGKIEDGIVSDCYARGSVTGSEENGGFAGAYMVPAVLRNIYAATDVVSISGGGIAGGKGFSFAEAGTPENCWYCSDSVLPQNSGAFENDTAWAKSGGEMRSVEFAADLSDKWIYDKDVNGGYPYLRNTVPPHISAVETVTVQMMIADYDSDEYEFYKLTGPIEISAKGEMVTVADVMAAASENNMCTYFYGVGEKAGQVVTIDGITPKAPDGWMFAVDGVLPSIGVNASIVHDGALLLWFVGTPENGYQPPDWQQLENGISPGDYVEIGTAQELLALTQNPNAWGGSYKLTANIDLSGETFTPIGNSVTPFSGRFDGNGFAVSNLTVALGKESQNVGMFGVTRGARLKNIVLNDVNITGGSAVGGLVGLADADADNESITLLTGCQVSGTVTAIGNSYIKQTDAGGLVGVNGAAEDAASKKNYLSVIDDCTANVDVIGDTGAADISDAGHIGGFVGWNKGTVSNSVSTGAVRGGNTTGGFVGSHYGGSIYSSVSTGAVAGAYTVGGFAGSAGLYSLIENSYSTGDVTALGDSGANYGGFAGALSGKAKNCVSAGSLAPGWSFNGGFAGRLSGSIWAYREELRSVSGCYGNITSVDGKTLKPIGNYIGGTHTPTDIAAEEIGVDRSTAEQKIAELKLKANAEGKVNAEAAKYKGSAAVPATVREEADITALVARMNANAAANDEIRVSYRAEGDVITAGEDGYRLGRKPSADVYESVSLIFELDGARAERSVSVMLSAEQKGIDERTLLKNVVEQYAQNAADYWEMSALCSYSDLYGEMALAEKVKENYLAQAVELLRASETDTTLAMNIIALRGLGYDPSDIRLEDGERLDAVQKLLQAPSTGNNGDAYRLLAYQNCGQENSAEAGTVVNRLLAAQTAEGGWSTGESDEVDPDSTGAVILGLSAYIASDGRVKSAVDNAVAYLSSLMQNDGNIKSGYRESNYGTNANTSAICAMGLAACGTDVRLDRRFVKNSVSLFDGIMSFAAADTSGFVYEYGDKQVNARATQQAALAIMAAEKKENILDFSDKEKNILDLNKESVSAGDETSGGGTSGGAGWKVNSQLENEEQKIQVTFTLVGDQVHGDGEHEKFVEWLSGVKVTVKAGASVRDVIEYILRENGYEVQGLDKGYVSAVTTPDGVSLGEYDNGTQSGWMFLVNGEKPNAGIGDYKLSDGDSIRLYYTDDWSKTAFCDVAYGEWFSEAAELAAVNGWIIGDENGCFLPESEVTRAAVTAVLGRYDGAGTAAYTGGFSDVSAADWFSPYVEWATASGVAVGTGGGMFEPEASVTREQLAAMLYRYALSKELVRGRYAAALTGYADAASVSEWAEEAMQWAVEEHLINGEEENILAPQNIANRAQFAVILMRFHNLVLK